MIYLVTFIAYLVYTQASGQGMRLCYSCTVAISILSYMCVNWIPRKVKHAWCS